MLPKMLPGIRMPGGTVNVYGQAMRIQTMAAPEMGSVLSRIMGGKAERAVLTPL